MILPLLIIQAAAVAASRLPVMATAIYWQSNNDNSTGTGCCIIVIIILVICVVGAISSSKQKAKAQAEAQAEQNKRMADRAKAEREALARAKASYQESLSALKSEPTSADLRQRTLELGRAYSNLTRSEKGVTLFDEVALMNDINAACGGALSAPPQDAAGEKPPIEERLAKLGELRIQGFIDEEEYRSRRQKILDEV